MKEKRIGFFSLLSTLILAACLSCSGTKPDDTPDAGKDQVIPEGWVFRVKVYGEERTVEENGGAEAFEKSVAKLLSDASKCFSTAGINDEGGNKMNFVMTGFEVFSGASSKYLNDASMEKETAYDLRLVINSYAAVRSTNGWQGAPYYSIGHNYDNPFAPVSLRYLVKELGRYRGLYDLTQESVPETGNTVKTKMPYAPEACYMTDPLAATSWSDYAKAVINANADSPRPKSYDVFIPAGVKTTVLLEGSGEVADGVEMEFYPVYPATGKVETAPAYSGAMSITGFYSFPRNPFIKPGQESRTDNVVNYLVKVTRNKRNYYSWLPMHTAVEGAIAQGGNVYTHTISIPDEALPDPSVEIPEGDYVNREWEFSQLPGWKYRVKVYGEQRTVRDVGTRIDFMKKVDKLLSDASKYFQVPGLNDGGGNQIHFYMVEFEEFTGDSKHLRYDPRVAEDETYDLRLVINGHADEGDVSGGWLGHPYYSLGHDFVYGLWEGTGVDALVHEFGHSRSVPDLYAEKVNASDNPINGKSYDSIRCRMNQCYGDLGWSSYAKALINASAGMRHSRKHEEFIPEKYTLKVTKDGKPVSAKVTMYPVYSYSYKVESTPLFSFTTAADGTYAFQTCPYKRTGQKDIFNYLTKIEYGGIVYYKWMPIHEPEEAVCRSGSDEYVHILNL